MTRIRRWLATTQNCIRTFFALNENIICSPVISFIACGKTGVKTKMTIESRSNKEKYGIYRHEYFALSFDDDRFLFRMVFLLFHLAKTTLFTVRGYKFNVEIFTMAWTLKSDHQYNMNVILQWNADCINNDPRARESVDIMWPILLLCKNNMMYVTFIMPYNIVWMKSTFRKTAVRMLENVHN